MMYAIKLHRWLLALNDMYNDNLISERVYHDSIDSVWNIAQLIGEKENLKKLTDEHYG